MRPTRYQLRYHRMITVGRTSPSSFPSTEAPPPPDRTPRADAEVCSYAVAVAVAVVVAVAVAMGGCWVGGYAGMLAWWHDGMMACWHAGMLAYWVAGVQA